MRYVVISLSVIADLLDPPLPRDNTRTHVSDLIKEAARLFYPKYHYKDGFTPQQENIMALGRIWEAAVRPMLEREAENRGGRFFPSVVLEVDGVIGSLDGQVIGPRENPLSWAVVEVKSRWAAPSEPRENWRWMTQGMAYCWMAGVQTLWIPALYLHHYDAQFILHVVDFSPQELAENWKMLLNVKGSFEDRKEKEKEEINDNR